MRFFDEPMTDTLLIRSPSAPDTGERLNTIGTVDLGTTAQPSSGNADALLWGFRPGVMTRCELEPDDLLALNPRQVN